MFNPEMSQAFPQKEEGSAPVTEAPAQIDTTQATVSEAEGKPESLADFAMRLENMLPREGDSLPEGGMEVLTGQWADQMDAMRQTEAREGFQKVIASQREMIREELFRDETVNGGSERKEGEELAFSQDQVAVGKSGASEWILEKLNHVPGGKKFLGALALIAGLSAIPKDAEADFFKDLGRAAGDIVTQSVRNIPRDMERQQRDRQQQRAAAEREAKQAARESEQLKERYAQESQRVVDQYDREDASAERNYDNQQRQILSMNTRNQDESLRKRMADRFDVSYHKEKLKAAERAWNGMSRVKEKYIQIGSTGVAYQSRVNEKFLENLQRVAAKAVYDLQEIGVEVVTIIPLAELMNPTPTKVSPLRGNTEQAPVTRIETKNESWSESAASGADYSLLSR